jgi:hypothetical protein
LLVFHRGFFPESGLPLAKSPITNVMNEVKNSEQVIQNQVEAEAGKALSVTEEVRNGNG